MSFLRSLLVILWMVVSFGLSAVFGLIRLGDPNRNRDFMRLFGKGACWIAGIKVEAEGLENYYRHESCIITANHQSGLDVAVFGVHYPDKTVVVVKRELAWIPIMGTFFLVSGNILINRKRSDRAMAALRDVAQTMVSKRLRVGFFPEGTRNRSLEGMLPFKKGAFLVALAAQVPIVPVVCGSLKKIGSMEKLNLKPGKLRIRVLEPISTSGLKSEDVNSLMETVRERMLTAYNELSS